MAADNPTLKTANVMVSPAYSTEAQGTFNATNRAPAIGKVPTNMT